MGGCQIVIIVLHLLTIPFPFHQFYIKIKIVVFHRHVFFPFKCFVVIVNHYVDGRIVNKLFILTLYVVSLCVTYEIKIF